MPQPTPAPSTPTIAKPLASRGWAALKLAGLLTFGSALDCPAPQRAWQKPEPLSTNYVAITPSRVITPTDEIIAGYEERARRSERTIIGLGCGLAAMVVAAGTALRAGHKYCLRHEELLSSYDRAKLLATLTRNRSTAVSFGVRPARQHLQAVLPTFAESEDHYASGSD